MTKDINIPVWGIFELLSLGEFGHFISCLNKKARTEISKSMGIRQNDDKNAMMPQRLVYAIRDLRNAIAHNNIAFDTRFRTSNIDSQMRNAISNATGVKNLKFETITDYFVLVIYQLKLLGTAKNDMRRLLKDYADITEKLRQSVPINVYNQIIYTDNREKLSKLKEYITN